VPTVRVIHRFHPLFGRDLEFVKRRRNWDADRVYVYDDGAPRSFQRKNND